MADAVSELPGAGLNWSDACVTSLLVAYPAIPTDTPPVICLSVTEVITGASFPIVPEVCGAGLGVISLAFA